MENKIRQLRAAHRLTQEELAEALNISRQTVVAIENGKSVPSLEIGLKMADFFGVKVEQIFKLPEDISKEKKKEKKEFNARRHGYL